jgi:PIN domain nuclease of toxin-antitoxin system
VILLLDTHVLLWLLAGDQRRFGADSRVALRDGAAVVSAATVWEITIKRSLGKLRAPSNLVHTLAGAGLQLLSITAVHAEHVGELPDFHRDPFDRILVAQALVEDLTILTADKAIARYKVSTLDPVY